MNYLHIYKCAISDGPGVRVSLYVSGCRNHCPGCHNQKSWDFAAGNIFTFQTYEELMDDLRKPYIKGLTICGGEPMEEENQKTLLSIISQMKKELPDKDIWCYTGYEFNDLLVGGKKHTAYTDALLKYLDVLVVGPFILNQKDITDNNRWRGSKNQRVIDIKKSLKENKAILLEGIPNNSF